MSEKEAKEQFEILYLSAQGKSLEVLLKEIIAHPYIYGFQEYLNWPKIKTYLSTPDGEKYSKLMDIFSYGTYNNYESSKASLPKLETKQLLKLKVLTLLSLFEKSRVVGFDLMKSELALSEDELVEDVIFEGISKGVIKGEISQRERAFYVVYSRARDCKPDERQSILEMLSRIIAKTERAKSELSSSLTSIESQVNRRQ